MRRANRPDALCGETGSGQTLECRPGKEKTLEQLDAHAHQGIKLAERLDTDSDWLNAEVAEIAKSVGNNSLFGRVTVNIPNQAYPELYKVWPEFWEKLQTGFRGPEMVEGGEKSQRSVFLKYVDGSIHIQRF